MNNNNGHIIVYVNQVEHVSGYFAKGSTVMDQCFGAIVQVEVKNTNTDAWSGAMQYSTDAGNTYKSFGCTECNACCAVSLRRIPFVFVSFSVSWAYASETLSNKACGALITFFTGFITFFYRF